MKNFSPASETNPLKIKLSITWRGIEPGCNFSGFRAELRPGLKKSHVSRKEISARAEKQEIKWPADSPETLRAQFHIWCRTNISARAEVRHVIATKFQPG